MSLPLCVRSVRKKIRYEHGWRLVQSSGKLPALPDITICQLAQEFVAAFAELTPAEQRRGPNESPLPCEALQLQSAVDMLRKPRIDSTRRSKPPTQVTDAPPEGMLWASAIVSGRFGKCSYQQAVSVELGSRLCLACLRKLPVLSHMIRQIQTNDTKGYSIEYRCSVDMFCNGQCYESYFVKRYPSSVRRQLNALKRGVCRSCGLDTARLQERLRRIPLEGRLAYFDLGAGGGASAAEANFFKGLTSAFWRRLGADPLRAADFWQADHVRAVADGGGEAEVVDFQTLCTVCHARKTKEEKRRRMVP